MILFFSSSRFLLIHQGQHGLIDVIRIFYIGSLQCALPDILLIGIEKRQHFFSQINEIMQNLAKYYQGNNPTNLLFAHS